MKTIDELKQGMDIYDISFREVKHYKYLCIHPTCHGKYHILIDRCEEPIRIYGKQLQSILDKNLNSYQDAKLALANKLEKVVNELRTLP